MITISNALELAEALESGVTLARVSGSPDTKRDIALDLDAFATRMAQGFIASMAHYGNCYPTGSDGRMATPQWYANRLGMVLNHRRDRLPLTAKDWGGARYLAYAEQLLEAEAAA